MFTPYYDSKNVHILNNFVGNIILYKNIYMRVLRGFPNDYLPISTKHFLFNVARIETKLFNICAILWCQILILNSTSDLFSLQILDKKYFHFLGGPSARLAARPQGPKKWKYFIAKIRREKSLAVDFKINILHHKITQMF